MLIPMLVAVLVAFASMQLSSLCTTIYLHRAMAHKGLKLHPAVAAVMRVQIWLFTGISMRAWVAVHRKHHHFTDEEGDPHSPYLKGLMKVLLLNALYIIRRKPERPKWWRNTRRTSRGPAARRSCRMAGSGWASCWRHSCMAFTC